MSATVKPMTNSITTVAMTNLIVTQTAVWRYCSPTASAYFSVETKVSKLGWMSV